MGTLKTVRGFFFYIFCFLFPFFFFSCLGSEIILGLAEEDGSVFIDGKRKYSVYIYYIRLNINLEELLDSDVCSPQVHTLKHWTYV